MTKATTNPWMAVSILLGVLLVASFITNAVVISRVLQFSGTSGTQVIPTQGDDPTVQPEPTGPVQIDLGNSPREGNAKATVTIVEFSDFECPFCQRYYNDAYKQMKAEYIDTGKVNFVFKQFPLTSIHPRAQKAAEASLCANEQGKFWEYHDTLFANQQALDVASLKQYAADLKLDTTKFNSCLDTSKYAGTVSAETNQGVTAGVQGTPTTFINGKKIVGAQPYAVIKAEIDAALAQ
jgi:protein-disulfide isomerase